jgi:hypothetical protein
VPALRAALNDYCDYIRVRAALALARVDPMADRTLPNLPTGYDELYRRERARWEAEAGHEG